MRQWFTPENTQMKRLTRTDLAIMNRAARLVDDNNSRGITHAELSLIRQRYKLGMSAADLAELAISN